MRFIDPDGMRIEVNGTRQERKMIRQWLRDVKHSGAEGRDAIRELRKSPNVHTISFVQYKPPAVGVAEEAFKQSNDPRAKDALNQKEKMLDGKSGIRKDIINDVASGGRPAVLNNSLANGMKDQNAYNGTGTGSDMYINNRTSFSTFVHELGHQIDSNRGKMDINTVKLDAAGYSGDWTRIKDENSADSFASRILGPGNSNYSFTQSDQLRYDEAVKHLQ
jgi:hypothetical protein